MKMNDNSLKARLHSCKTIPQVNALLAEAATYTFATDKWKRRVNKIAKAKKEQITAAAK